MQITTYNIIDKMPVYLWRAIPAQITVTGIEDTSGTWVFLLDNDWKDGALVIGSVTVDNGNLIVTLDDLDSTYLASVISGKEKIQCKGTLTNAVNQCYLITVIIQNRTINNAPPPTPATSYYTKAQTDTLLSAKADESALGDYLLKTGGKISSLVLSNSSDTPLFSFQDGTNNGILFSQSYVNSNITISTTLFRVRNSTVTISAAGGLNLQSSINEINYNNHAKNTAGGLCVLDNNGNLNIPGDISFVPSGAVSEISLTEKFDDYLPRNEKCKYRPDYYFIRVENPENGAWSFKVGDVNSPTLGLVSFYGNNVNLGGVSTVTIGYSANSIVLHGGANPNTAKGFCILDENGNLNVPGSVNASNKEVIELESATFTPENGKIYIYTLTGNTAITFNNVSQNKTIDFELHIVQGNTAYNVTWPNGLKWGDKQGNFSANNEEPDISGTNTLYAFTVRNFGPKTLINLAYTQEL